MKFFFLYQDPQASYDLNDNDNDPMPRDSDADNWYEKYINIDYYYLK